MVTTVQKYRREVGADGVPYGVPDGFETVDGPPPTPDNIRAEAQRRIMALVGATDLNACIVKQLNAQMRASELIDKKASGGTLSQAEQIEAAALAALAAGIKLIRARSNEIEASAPADWQEDARWS